MKTEVFVNSEYSEFGDLIKQIPQHFNSLGREIHHGRNEIRVANEKGTILTIKYFKRITLANRLIFATVRKSKARRAYEHSQLLIQKGITTPKPIAYINTYKYGILHQSYYISLYTNYTPIKELLELPIPESENALKAFARFSYKLQQMGVLHKDYTVQNVLYCFTNNEYDFSLIDNNRMRFRRYSYRRGIKNLERLKIPVERMGIIAVEYAKQTSTSDISTLNAMTFYRMEYLLKVSIKKWIKTLIHSTTRENDKMLLSPHQKETKI